MSDLNASTYVPFTKPSANGTAQNGQAPAKPQTDVTVTNDRNSHDVTRIAGDTVTRDATDTRSTSVHGQWPAEADEHVRNLIHQAEKERQEIEDVRANHRNHNRLYTLVFTLLAGLFITFALSHGWLGTFGIKLAPYSFVITVAGDTLLTGYALYKHY